MSSDGPRYPSSASSSAAAPENANAWVNPTDIGSDNATYASITAATYDSPDISERLLAQGFGFTLPDTATIDGVVVEIDRYCGAGSAVDNRVQLLNSSGTIVGNNKSSATAWPGSATIATYGSSTDGWGASLTPAIINSANFGVALSVKATSANTDIFVDFIRVTVYYTYAGQTISGATSLSADATLAGVGGYIAPSIFSEGFESGDLSRWTTIQQGQGTVYATSAALKNGSFGIKVNELSTYTAATYVRKVVSSSDTVRSSGWFYTVSDGPSGNNNANLRVFSSGTRIVDLYRQNVTGGLWLRYLDGASASKYVQLAADGFASVGQWYKLDVYIKYAGAGSVSTLIAWINDSQVVNASSYSLKQGAYDTLQIGAEHVSQHVDIYADDLYWTSAPGDPTGSTQSGAASLSGSATLASIASMTYGGIASITGSAALSAAGGLVILGASNLSALATLSAVGGNLVSGAAALDGSATLASIASLTLGSAASLSASATISPTASITLGGQAALNAAATLAAAGLLTIGGQASLTGDATLSAIGAIIGSGSTVTAAASLSALATIAAIPGVTLGAIAQLSSSADLSAIAGVTRGAAASLSADASVTGAASLLLGAIVSASASASVGAIGRLTLGGQASLSGDATISPTPSVTYRSSASLTGDATLTAVGFLPNEPSSGPPPPGTILLLKIGR